MPKRKRGGVSKPATTESRAVEDIPAVAASSSLAAGQSNVQYLASPVTSDLDPNQYRSILLPNGLRVVLVAVSKDHVHEDFYGPANRNRNEQENSEYTKRYWERIDNEKKLTASCYLSINVGDMSDPPEVPGVSSVLCRILKESGSEEFERKWRCEYDGIWTEEHWEETSYRFHSGVEKYREKLEAFVQKIVNVAPSRDRFKRDRKQHPDPDSDSDYGELLMRNREETTFVNFVTTGNPMRTAGHSLFALFDHISKHQLYMHVLKFRKRHYSANRMVVLLQAPLPLDTLETYAIETFSKIPNNGLPPETFKPYHFENSFDRTKLRRIWINLGGIDDCPPYEMQVHWIMPPTRSAYKAKSLEYLAWIFNAIGPGTLHDYLINKQWADTIDATIPRKEPWNTSLHSTFTITVGLSESGNSNGIHILEAIYSYINLLKREGPQEGIYDGIRINEDAKFRFEIRSDRDFRDDKGTRIYDNLHQYESADCISGPRLYCEYDPLVIADCLEIMAPTGGCVFVNNEEFVEHFTTTEPRLNHVGDTWSYRFPKTLIQRWKTIAPLPEFKLPEANKFWADDLTIIDPPKTYTKNPSIVHSDAVSEVWYKFDPSVRAPICHMNLCYSSPLPLESVENFVMLTFLATVLESLMQDESELAKRAGLSNSIKVCSSKLVIAIDGFRDKVPLLMETIVRFVRESHVLLTKKLFESAKSTSFQKNVRIWLGADRVARHIRELILIPGNWIVMDIENAILSITFAEFRNFLQTFINDVHLKFLVQGNVSESMAVETARRVVQLSKCKVSPSRTMPRRLINKIPSGTHRCKIKIGDEIFLSPMRCLINYYQFDDSTVERAVLIDALKTLIHDYRFSELCKVFTGSKYIKYVKKDDCSVNNVWFQLDAGESVDLEKIELIDEASLERLTSALKGSAWEELKSFLLSEAIRNSRNEIERNWNEIIHGGCDFDRHSREIDAIKKLEAENFVDFIKQLTADDSTVRRLSIMLIGWPRYPGCYETRLRNLHEPPLPLFEYLTESSEGEESTSQHYITDVVKFKNELERLL